MIGHVFASSGAVCLAVAPSSRAGDYVALVKHEGQYATVLIDAARMVAEGGAPSSWMRGTYFTEVSGAVEDLANQTGLDQNIVARHVTHAESLLAQRTALV